MNIDPRHLLITPIGYVPIRATGSLTRGDSQKAHARDEVYVVATGASHFIRGKEECPVIPGDVLFVPAGEEHRFVSFTDDFSTWVFFYGPDGGERS